MSIATKSAVLQIKRYLPYYSYTKLRNRFSARASRLKKKERVDHTLTLITDYEHQFNKLKS